MISDDPAKALGHAKQEELFPERLKEIIGQPTTELELVSAYFVPTDAGVKSFVGFAKSGVKVKVPYELHWKRQMFRPCMLGMPSTARNY